jgi:hypothetical protein
VKQEFFCTEKFSKKNLPARKIPENLSENYFTKSLKKFPGNFLKKKISVFFSEILCAHESPKNVFQAATVFLNISILPG